MNSPFIELKDSTALLYGFQHQTSVVRLTVFGLRVNEAIEIRSELIRTRSPAGQRTTVYGYRMPDRRDVGVAILIPASGSRYRLIRLQFTRVPGERHLPLRIELEVAFIASPDPRNWFG